MYFLALLAWIFLQAYLETKYLNLQLAVDTWVRGWAMFAILVASVEPGFAVPEPIRWTVGFGVFGYGI